MSKLRSISKEIRLSQSFARLTLRQRDLWHGLIATADDQGRLPGHPAAIRSIVWPYDDILLSKVQKDLDVLMSSENILIYQYGDQSYIQIINWWKYQKMQWAGSSKYPAPEGWLDRERFHGKGRKIFTKNWNTPGGFFIQTNDDNVNVNDNARRKSKKTKVEDKGSQLPKNLFPSSNLQPKDLQTARQTLLQVHSNLDAFEDSHLAKVHHMLTVYGPDRARRCLQSAYAKWCEGVTERGNRYNPNNPAWVDKAADLAKSVQLVQAEDGGYDV